MKRLDLWAMKDVQYIYLVTLWKKERKSGKTSKDLIFVDLRARICQMLWWRHNLPLDFFSQRVTQVRLHWSYAALPKKSFKLNWFDLDFVYNQICIHFKFFRMSSFHLLHSLETWKLFYNILPRNKFWGILTPSPFEDTFNIWQFL